MTFGSVCSGIEAASVAWEPLGWRCAFVSEVDRFPCVLLSHYWPYVPNYGDLNECDQWPAHAIDVLVGGTPCQDFSVAGRRAGLGGARGGLTMRFLDCVERYAPTWVVWENVPGVLSIDAGAAFGAFLGGLAKRGYGFAYRVLDAQYFGLAQRRERVFVVGCAGGQWQRAAAVLFDAPRLRWNPPPSRQAGQGTAPTISARTKGGGGLGADAECDGAVIPLDMRNAARTTEKSEMNRQSCGVGEAGDPCGTQEFIPAVAIAHSLTRRVGACEEDGTGRGSPLIAHTLSAEGHDASEDSTERGVPLVAMAANAKGGSGRLDGESETFVTATIDASYGRLQGASGQDANHGHSHLVAWDMRGREGGAQFEGPHDTANVRASSGGSSRSYVAGMAVRRLTPREVERLQGFPYDFTLIPYRGKPACDGPRYRALGNSMAVPLISWLGRRIALVASL